MKEERKQAEKRIPLEASKETKVLRRARKRKPYDGLDIVSFLLLTFLAAVIAIPFWNAIVISLETYSAYVKAPAAMWPGEFILDNYKYLLERGSDLLRAYRNTVLVTLGHTLSCVAVTTLTGYVFSLKFPGKKFFFGMMVVTMFFGGGMIPSYLLYKRLNLIDSLWCIVLIGMVAPYYIIVMKNGFESVPVELREAAVLDGAGELAIFARVSLPLQKAVVAAVSLFAAVGSWNGWYWPMLVLNDPKKTMLQPFLRTLIMNASNDRDAAGMAEYMSQEAMATYSMGIQMAAVITVILPIMMIYPFLQKYFTKGVMVGGVKM